MAVNWAGSSWQCSGAFGHRVTVQPWMYRTYQRYAFTHSTCAVSGQNSWANLVRLETDCLANNPGLIILEHANDSTAVWCKKALEALFRRIAAALPAARIIILNAAGWAIEDLGDDAKVDHPANEAAILQVEALAAYYGIPVIDYWGWCQSVVPDTYHLIDLCADGAHPTAIGYAAIAELLKPYLPLGGSPMPSPLPARLYDTNGDYENTPVRKLGTQYKSRTGTGWGDDGTSTSSSTPGDTITYGPITCQSIGGIVNANVQISVDGGDFYDFALYPNGGELSEGRGSHEITIKVGAETVDIDEFWAI